MAVPTSPVVVAASAAAVVEVVVAVAGAAYWMQAAEKVVNANREGRRTGPQRETE